MTSYKTPVVASSLPSDFVNPIKPALATEPTGALGLPLCTATLAMLTMPAVARSIICRHKRPCHEVGRNEIHLNDSAGSHYGGSPRLHIRPGDACVIDQDVDLAERFQRGLPRRRSRLHR